ncbi:MAG: cytochrome c1 [Rhodobacteraceae bacterium]|nr:cytochrome c1 [Paracoccaceae bacterium]
MDMKKILTAAVVALGHSTQVACAAGGAGEVKDVDFSFDGPLGTYDQMQLQRGLQVYTEVCSGCHGLRQVAFRTLTDLGYSPDQVKTYASRIEIWDPELLDGEGDFRPAAPADHFPAVTSAGAPDLSMMAKARAGFHGPYGLGLNQLWYGMGGPEYIVALLDGYTGEEKEEAGVILYENKAFPGGWISMSPVLYGDDVEFADGHATDVYNLSRDVAAFLMWAAEPKLPQRKQFGLVGVGMLTILSILLYLTNKKLWKPIKYRGGRTVRPAE